MPRIVSQRRRRHSGIRPEATGLLREFFLPPATLLPCLGMVGWLCGRRALHGWLAPHFHPGTWEIHWVRQGSLDWWVGDTFHTISPGMLFVTRPDEPHGARHQVLEPCELYWLQIAADRAGEVAELAALLAALADGPRLIRAEAGLAEPWQGLLDEMRQPDAWSPHAVRGLLGVLCAGIGRCVAADAARRSPAIAAALAWLEAQSGWIHPVGALARAAGVPPARLHALFAAEMGMTPAAWMRHRRLGEAKRRLAGGRQEITVIAMDLGFRTSQHFATQFRRAIGDSPGAWRRRVAADGPPVPGGAMPFT